MREIYSLIRSYIFNGIFAYALFGIYALTVTPILTQFFSSGEKNIFISIFGFVMLIAEFFALSFKLKMVRARAEEKRIVYRKETGIDIIPSTNLLVFFGFFMRLVFHIFILMVSLTAFGYLCTEEVMSNQALIIISIWFVADIIGCFYIYSSSDFYTDFPQERILKKDAIEAESYWHKTYKKYTASDKYFRMELFSDIILQVYALMLFTSAWQYINQTGIDILHDSMHHHESAFKAAINLFPMLFYFVIIGMMPLRIAYWIEDSMQTQTSKVKYGTWFIFIIVAIFTCAPSIIKFISLFILHYPDTPEQFLPEYFNYLLSISFFLILLFMEIVFVRSKKQKVQ